MEAQKFIKVTEGRLFKNGVPYVFLGTNFWYGLNLGSTGEGGDRRRLIQELDHLKELGILNLRIMAASEGPDDQPWRMLPSLQTAPGIYNEKVLIGLDFLLNELNKREMHAVLCLNNMWPWSGGFAQYINWVERKPIPYPPPAENGSWLEYTKYTQKFFNNDSAQQLFKNHIKLIINRTNTVNGIKYQNDPTIMSWQLANEPRSLTTRKKYFKWIKETSEFIKSLDSNHLVSIGSEGNAFFPFAHKYQREHKIKTIDYCTAHIWIQNWRWYDPLKHEKTYPKALKKAKRYLSKHIAFAKQIEKPFVLEEFGIARDNFSYDSKSSVKNRDHYFMAIFSQLYEKNQVHVAGCNFWAWGGKGRPKAPGAIWKKGDPFIGDPPFEHQGWYSIYDSDISTLDVIRKFTKNIIR
ncbi:MAG: beta-mannanase [Flavobacteriales bacterium]|nr:beta-mannanase [Flavobacteriales bacterium]